MKNIYVILLLVMSSYWTNIYAQHTELDDWYNTIDSIYFSLKSTEHISVQKEVLCNGSIVPIAHGKFTYNNSKGDIDTIPFLYYYGRVTMKKKQFDSMISSIPDTTTVNAEISFLPIRIWTSQKMNSINVFIFTTRKRNLYELYINRDHITVVRSFWAITSIKNCYKVLYNDYGLGGWYYHIPCENNKRKQIINRLDKLSKKQYCKGFYLLNYFLDFGEV